MDFRQISCALLDFIRNTNQSSIRGAIDDFSKVSLVDDNFEEFVKMITVASDFMSFDIFVEILGKLCNEKIYSNIFNYNGIEVCLNTIGDWNTKKCYRLCLRNLFLIVILNNDGVVSNGKIVNSCELNLFLSDKKKYFPDRGKIIKSDYVNSAVCYPFQNRICIYREEEILKVLIHEICHFTNVDQLGLKIVHPHLQIQRLNHYGEEEKDDINRRKYESFAEIVAIIISSILSKGSIKEQLEEEMDFSSKQSSNILLHNGFRNVEELFQNGGVKVKEMTNSVAYHIIKSIYLHNLDSIMELLVNGKEINSLELDEFSKLVNSKMMETDINRISGDSFRMSKQY
jgi:hypothetical protein